MSYPEDGICPYCKMKKSKTNWSRHLSVVHADEIKRFEAAQSTQQSEEQQKLDKFVTVGSSSAKPNRILALYAGTSTMPLQHVENNRYLVVSL